MSALSVAGPIVEEGAEVEKLRGGFQFTEGPAFDGDKRVLFTDIPANRIYAYNHGKDTISVFREDTGGANGLMFDQRGRLVMCEGGNRRVTRLEPDGSVTVLADTWNANKLNSPNDLVIRENGGIYFTDPRYGDRSSMEMEVEGVYYISPDGNELERVIDDLVRPNGLMLSRDGSTLYVADPGDDQTWAYDVQEDGSLEDKRLFTDSGSDGMTLDHHGNVYLTSGAVLVFNPDGERIAKIDIPEKPSNLTFGPPGRGTLYITARTGFYRIDTNVHAGRKPVD
jgi:gluconolactonase